MSRMTEMTKSWNAKQDYAFQFSIYNWLYYYACGLNCWIVLHYVCHYVLYYVLFCQKRICSFSLNYVCTWINKNEQIIIRYPRSFISMCLSAVQGASSVMICLHLSGLLQQRCCGWLNTYFKIFKMLVFSGR